jgi:hypothetical protein
MASQRHNLVGSLLLAIICYIHFTSLNFYCRLQYAQYLAHVEHDTYPCTWLEKVMTSTNASGHSTSEEMHVALLLGGSVRSLVLPLLHNNLKRFLIDEIQNSSNAKVHLILDVSLLDASSWKTPSNFPNISEEALSVACEALQPDSISLYSASNLGLDPADPLGRGCNDTTYHLSDAAIAHFNVSKRMYNNAQQVAQDAGIEIEWYVRTRPDLMWFNPFPLDLRQYDGYRNAVIYDSIWPYFMADHFYIVHQSVANALWAEGSSVLTQLPCALTPPGTYNPEALLASTLKSIGVKPVPIAFGGLHAFARHNGLHCSSNGDIPQESTKQCQTSSEIYLQQLAEWMQSGSP